MSIDLYQAYRSVTTKVTVRNVTHFMFIRLQLLVIAQLAVQIDVKVSGSIPDSKSVYSVRQV